ncbi:serine/threonine protein kinase [Lysobacter sp. TAB13]|uniref:serine/threonine protein kinase n=1 Tax=Lysobacter sp. TAB13 TaxID=3233065 RepID=UPI003F9BA11A
MNNDIDMKKVAVEICAQRAFEFLGDLGKGSFKSAFLVKSQEQELALKIALVSGSVDRLIRETEALIGCAHKNIATLLSAFPLESQGRTMWVTIENLIPGGTLEAKLLTRSISPDEVRYIGLCLADVLDHLNDRRLVHRDIKPANILFASDGQTPILTDFGVVRVLDQPSLTRDFVGFGPGTPAYAAPEQLNNEKQLIDWRTDQFGLAVVLAECLLGHHPFMRTGGSIQEAIISVGSRHALPPENQKALCDLQFSALVNALSPWPIARYRRPQDLISALSI